MREEGYPSMPKWTLNQKKLFDAVSEAVQINMPSSEMTPVFEYFMKWSRVPPR